MGEVGVAELGLVAAVRAEGNREHDRGGTRRGPESEPKVVEGANRRENERADRHRLSEVSVAEPHLLLEIDRRGRTPARRAILTGRPLWARRSCRAGWAGRPGRTCLPVQRSLRRRRDLRQRYRARAKLFGSDAVRRK